MGDNGRRGLASGNEDGFGLVGVVISLLIVALLSVGALKAFAGGTGTGAGTSTFNPTVDQAYDVQAQSALSSTMQNVRDGAISNGGFSASDLAQEGVTTSPSGSPSDVSGAAADTDATGGVGGPLGPGSVTLAAESKSGTCWFVWFSTSATWYGFEPDATSCQAEPMMAAPSTSGITGDDRLAARFVPDHGMTTRRRWLHAPIPCHGAPVCPVVHAGFPGDLRWLQKGPFEPSPGGAGLAGSALGTRERPMSPRCAHIDQITDPIPSSTGCEDCLASGRRDWLHLRVCQTCGHVGCCDSSPGRHATGHFGAAAHPVVRSYEPGEGWYWCYSDEVAYELADKAPAPSHP